MKYISDKFKCVLDYLKYVLLLFVAIICVDISKSLVDIKEILKQNGLKKQDTCVLSPYFNFHDSDVVNVRFALTEIIKKIEKNKLNEKTKCQK